MTSSADTRRVRDLLDRLVGLWTQPVVGREDPVAAFRTVYADPVVVNGVDLPVAELVGRASAVQETSTRGRSTSWTRSRHWTASSSRSSCAGGVSASSTRRWGRWRRPNGRLRSARSMSSPSAQVSSPACGWSRTTSVRWASSMQPGGRDPPSGPEGPVACRQTGRARGRVRTRPRRACRRRPRRFVPADAQS